jgi:YfiH family protein
MSARDFIRHPLLESCGVEHGFGTRNGEPPASLIRPRQVHGTNVHLVGTEADPIVDAVDVEADAVCSTRPGQPIAIITADCVPILACTKSGSGVLAVHAGWRGLANGVIEAGVHALHDATGNDENLCAVIGPHIGACCYEVDRPVLDAMTQRFGDESVALATTMTRPGHAQLSLGILAAESLTRMGVDASSIAQLEGSCTACEAAKFHSYRRDGEAAGRMTHFIVTP